jgi:hypothetical protein
MHLKKLKLFKYDDDNVSSSIQPHESTNMDDLTENYVSSAANTLFLSTHECFEMEVTNPIITAIDSRLFFQNLYC